MNKVVLTIVFISAGILVNAQIELKGIKIGSKSEKHEVTYTTVAGIEGRITPLIGFNNIIYGLEFQPGSNHEQGMSIEEMERWLSTILNY